MTLASTAPAAVSLFILVGGLVVFYNSPTLIRLNSPEKGET